MITAIIPCYNAESYLAEAIESVLAQTRPVDEIVVVDDCSTDDSRAIARRYPVTILQTPSNRGHAAARNLGIEASRGDVIAWLDADDYWEPNHCEVVVALMERYPEVGVAFSKARRVGLRSGLWPDSPCDYQPRDVFWHCFERTIVPAMSVITRKEAINRVGRCNDEVRIAPDFDLWLRMSRHYPFVSTPEATSNYRWHGNQISSDPAKQIRSMFAARLRLAAQLRRDGEKNLAQQVENKAVDYWDTLLTDAWSRGDIMFLREVLSWRECASLSHRRTIGIRIGSRLPIRLSKLINSNI